MAMPIDLYRNYDSEDEVYAEGFIATFPPINAIDNGLEIYDWSWSQHNFLGWNTARDGSGTSYQSGDSVPSGVYTFYAIWEEAVVVPDVTVTYAGSQITYMSASGTKTLLTSGKYCEDDITIQYTKPPVITPVYQTKTVSPTTSPQTISPDNGYDGLSQVTVNAISPTRPAQTYTPTTTDQTIQSGRWLTGAQTIKGDANLVAGNIKKDVQIFNVTGTYDGPVVPNVNAKDVIFIDYDGTVLYSYTASEFAALTAIPANPSHTGLTAQGWNWTLSDAKTYVASYKKLVIGQMYTTSDGKTKIYIELPDRRLTMPLRFSQSVSNGVTIDWGDGTTAETISGTGSKTTSHTYASEGKYVIALNATSGTFTFDSHIFGTNSAYYSYKSSIQKVEIGNNCTAIGGSYVFYSCRSLESITIPNTVLYIGAYSFAYCSRLRSITFPANNSLTAINLNTLNSCYSLLSVSIPKNITSIGNTAFQLSYALNKVTLPPDITTISESVLYSCGSLSYIAVPSGVTTISSNAFYSCTSLAVLWFLPTTPPTVSNSNAFSSLPTDCVLLVPYNTSGLGSQYLDNYVDATNYPLSNTYKYIGYATFANNIDLGDYTHTSVGLELKWYASLNDAITETNRITRGNGNEIYCSISSGAIQGDD